MAMSNFGRTAPVVKKAPVAAKPAATIRAPLVKHTSTPVVVGSIAAARKAASTPATTIKTAVPATTIKTVVPATTVTPASTTTSTDTPESIAGGTQSLLNDINDASLSTFNDTGIASTAENNAATGKSNTWTPFTGISPDGTPTGSGTPVNASGTTGTGSGGASAGMTAAQIQKMIDDGIAAGLKGLNTDKNTDPNPNYIQAITSLLGSYGIGDLGPSVVNSVQKGFTPDTINLIMQDPSSSDPLALAYQKRFPANAILFKAGKPVLSPAQYLNNEKAYSSVLQAHGLSKYATPDNFTQFISKDVSPTEVNDRVLLGVDRVQNADQNTKDALKQFYPSLNQTDIIGALLDPNQGLPDLQRKIQIGEIGGAALAQGLEASAIADKNSMGAGALADLGVTKAQAQTGYGNLATYLPTAQKLSDIYKDQTGSYGQAQGEGDVFQNLASAQRARQGLNNLEQGTFSGNAGTLGMSFQDKISGQI